MCCDAPSAPAPDPNIGIAAAQNAETAKAMLEMGKDQLAWNKEQYADIAPFIKDALQTQSQVSKDNQDRATEQWQRYKDLFAPVEDQYVKEAMNEGSDAQQAQEADKARAAVAGSYEAQKGAAARNLARMGVNPNSAKFADFELSTGNAQAADEAGAANTARTNARLRGMAMRQGVAQFGRGMPSTGIAADQLALSGASGSVGSAGASINAGNAGAASALPWYQGSVGANTAAGNLYLGQFNAQMQGYQAQTAADSQMFGGLGNLGGMVLSAGKAPWWLAAKGGIIKKWGVQRKGYASGGIVRGPGDGSVDTVPATVDGKQPAALANGEGVLNAPATKLVGEDFVHRVNQVGLMLDQIMKRGTRAPVTVQGEAVPA
jgi:hypothetical protein